MSQVSARASPEHRPPWHYKNTFDAFRKMFLDEARVALAPGEGFGPAGAGHARISLAVADEALDEGLARLRDGLA